LLNLGNNAARLAVAGANTINGARKRRKSPEVQNFGLSTLVALCHSYSVTKAFLKLMAIFKYAPRCRGGISMANFEVSGYIESCREAIGE
jgi:hypothetical protein